MVRPGARTYLKTHSLYGMQLQFDLRHEREAALLRARQGKAGRAAKTLVKEGPLRLVLVALRKDAAMRKHHVDGPATIEVLQGAMRLRSSEAVVDLKSGGLVMLNAGIEHDVQAKTDTAFLITMAWFHA